MLEERFNRGVDRLSQWFGWQLGIIQGKSKTETPTGFQPSFATGALVLAALAYQVVSGGLLLLYYQPSVFPTLTVCGQSAGTVSSSPAAWCSTYYIVHSVPMGGVLLTSHLYGAYVVIFLMLVHLFRGFYAGAYKQPGGKFSWMAGTVLLLLMLGMGFTGYLLTYTQLSYNATQVSVTLLEAIPWVGSPLATLVVGDGTPQSLLSRMFALHVVLLPVGIALLVFLHKRSSLFPRAFGRLVKWGLLYVGLLLGVASVWLWSLPTYAGNPLAAPPATVPAWFFLWVFKLVDFEGVTPEDAMLFAALVFLFLLFLPLLDRSRRTHPRDRPVFLFLGNSLVGFFILMTAWGDLAPGVPTTPGEVALRLGPVLAGNAIAVAFFYGRYRRNGNPPTPDHIPTPESSPASAPAFLTTPDGFAPRQGRARSVVSPTLLSVLGLIAALFLLSFGLLLPVLFLLAAILVNIAESARPPVSSAGARSPSDWGFPITAFVSVAALLLATVVAVVG